jgi:hypothetical protein
VNGGAEIVELKPHVKVESCSFDLTGPPILARYPTLPYPASVTSLPFDTGNNGSMKVTNAVGAASCPVYFKSGEPVNFASTYALSPALTVTNPQRVPIGPAPRAVSDRTARGASRARLSAPP